jgi:hypothetical protein
MQRLLEKGKVPAGQDERQEPRYRKKPVLQERQSMLELQLRQFSEHW